MKPLFHSLQARLSLLTLLVVLLGLAGLFYQSYIAREFAKNAAYQRAVNTIDNAATNQSLLIDKTEKFLKALATIPPVLNLESVECSNALANILKFNDNYVNLGVPRADGQLLCNAMPLKMPVNVSDRPYIKKALASKAFSIGQYQIDRAAGVSSINFAYPVIDPLSQNILGLAVAVVSLDWWSKYLSQSRLPENTVAYVTDQNDKIIATYPVNSALLGIRLKQMTAEPMGEFTVKNKISAAIETVDDHQRVFVSKPLSRADELIQITFSVGIPIDKEIAAINYQLMKSGIVMLIFVSILFLFAAWGIKVSVLNPLKSLIRSTKSLELGRNVENSTLHGALELVDLQKRFAVMAQTRLMAEEQLKDSQSSLKASERKLSGHIENTPLGCISWDENFVCTEWNKSAEDIFGFRAKEVIGLHASKFIVIPELLDELNTFFTMLEQNRNRKQTNKNMTKDGSIIICEWYNTLIYAEDGSVSGIASLVQDITQRTLLEEKLKLSASVFSHAREGIIITDAAGNIIDVNDTFINITGYDRDAVIGQNPNMLSSKKHSPQFYEVLWKSLADVGYWSGEIWNKRRNGEIYPQLLTISAVNDDLGEVKNYVAVFTDITEMKKHQRQLEHMAHFDVLTHLPNRTLLADRLNQAIIQSKRNLKPVAVAFLDLDGFKWVNDFYGHKFGDELLVGLAKRFKETLRQEDTLSRFGGDEFVAVLTHFDKREDLEATLDRLLEAGAKPFTIQGNVITVSVSIGFTIYPQDNADAEQLIRHADQAMYVSKQQGKNRYHLFDRISDDEVKTQLDKIQGIANALEKREFELYYQPKVNMRTGDVVGVEALIRWQHPTRGLLSPTEFLPLIENHPLSIDIGEWVLDQALTQIAMWQTVGLKLSVSVNIGALQLLQEGFVERLAMLLSLHSDVQPNALQLEVLETSALGDIMEASAIMNSCTRLGVSFAIDDFGTGYSSLTYLRRLPANLIKIDQTFIRDMLDDPDDKSIVTGVIALAKSFNRQVIAEGVETVAHGTELLKLECELAQGYGIAKPMPAQFVAEWVEHWRPNIEWTQST